MEHLMVNMNWEWNLVWQLVLATVLGALVGLEREIHGRPAGLRTHILVCLGAALIIVAFEQLQTALVDTGGEILRLDPARVAAGVITGIGFLGAGTILKGKDHVTGLTTAASIWVVAAIGVTTGMGQYFLALVTTFLVLFALFVLHKIDIKTEHYGEITLKGAGGLSFYKKARDQITKMGFRVKAYNIEAYDRDGEISVRFLVKYKESEMGDKVIGELFQIEGVNTVSWEES